MRNLKNKIEYDETFVSEEQIYAARPLVLGRLKELAKNGPKAKLADLINPLEKVCGFEAIRIVINNLMKEGIIEISFSQKASGRRINYS